jgi:phthiodiolone/phenolphthiodiolone dimycocerosates ketoreductase
MLKFGTIGPTFPPVESIWERVKRNEEMGYDSVWFPDHLMNWYPQAIWTPDVTSIANYIPSPHMIWETMISMALAAKETTKIRIGCSVTEPIRRHPVMIAQAIVTIDNVARGRAILGMGAGEGENIIPYGLDFSKPVSKLEEAIKIIRLCFNNKIGQTINFDGKFWKLKDAVFDTPLYQGHKPPIWVGGVMPRMLEIVGKYADGWLPALHNAEEYRRCLNVIEEVMRREGRDPKELEKAAFVSVVVDKDKKSCLELLKSPLLRLECLALPSAVFEKYGYEHPLGKGSYGIRDYIPSRLSRERALELARKVPDEILDERFVYGGPSDLIDTFEKLRKAGCEHIVIWNETFIADFNKVRSSYAYIKEVMDYFKKQ